MSGLLFLALAIPTGLALAVVLALACRLVRARQDRAELERMARAMTPAERAVRFGDLDWDDLAGGDDA